MQTSPLRRLTIYFRGKGEADDALVTAARGGDRRAFDTLVDRHQARLRGFLLRRVGADAADDVLQETLLACWIALPRFDGRSRFKTWLYGIATHKCADYARVEKLSALAASPVNELDDGLPSVEALYARTELRETVQALLRMLPDAQREVIEMYYYAELTLPEIASALGRNLNTVKYQFYRAHALVAQGLDRPACPAGEAPRPDGVPGPSGVFFRP